MRTSARVLKAKYWTMLAAREGSRESAVLLHICQLQFGEAVALPHPFFGDAQLIGDLLEPPLLLVPQVDDTRILFIQHLLWHSQAHDAAS